MSRANPPERVASHLPPANTLVTGASSGLGRALALVCARPGATLHLGGRDAGRLAETAAHCRAQGAEAQIAALDVTDEAGMADWIGGCGRLDLVFANAGRTGGTGSGTESPDATRAIFRTNVDGVLNTALPAIQAMRGQTPGTDGWRGRVAVIASIAALVAAPGAPAYCASKAAVDRWAVALAPSLRRDGIELSSACPGYIRTPMTERNRFPMPGLMDADRAARLILDGVMAGRRRVAFPWWMAAGATLAGLLPPALLGATMGRLPGKD